MKIKVAIYEQDQNYQNRLLVALKDKFRDNLEVFRCTSPEDALKVIEAQEIKVFAVSQMITMDFSQVPQGCAIVVMTESKSDESIKDYLTMCKYQRIYDIGDQLYRAGRDYDKILAKKREKEQKELEERLERERKEREEQLKREKEAEEKRKRLEEERLEKEREAEKKRQEEQRIKEEREKQLAFERQKALEERRKFRRRNPDVYAFISSQAGEGGSVTSIASTVNALDEKHNILYLELSQFGKMERFFTPGSAQVSGREVLSKAIRGTLSGSDVEKAVSTDSKTGIRYIFVSDCMYEVGNLGREGFENLMKAIGEMEYYDAVVINLESYMSSLTYAAMARSKKTIFVGNGQHDSNAFLQKRIEAVKRYDTSNNTHVIKKVNVLYNKYENRKSSVLINADVTTLGPIPVLKERNDVKLLETMIKQDVFKKIVEF